MKTISHRTFVRLFKPQFARLVESGEKRQTVRPVPKRIPLQGDLIDCREWSGRPYMSPQLKLGVWEITSVRRVDIYHGSIFIDGSPLNKRQREEFARGDGFGTPEDMIQWFRATHGLPFEGILIQWMWGNQTDKYEFPLLQGGS